jgi:oligoendopeptidase F
MELIKRKRTFLPPDFSIENWDKLEPFYVELGQRHINSEEEFIQWFKDRSELESVVAEDAGWRYINMTRYTDNEAYQKAYQHFIQHIEPKIAPWEDKLNRKALGFRGFGNIKHAGYSLVKRGLEKETEIFREKNIPLVTKTQEHAQEYQGIIGRMTIQHEGKEYTLPQAATFLQATDRSLREKIYFSVNERRNEDAEGLNTIFTKLVHLRQNIAENADFSNYRDYMFAKLGRFDYTPADCFEFHESIATATMPLVEKVMGERKSKLAVKDLRPWDLSVDPENRMPLKPFTNADELLQKSIACFNAVDPFFGDCLVEMKKRERLDLGSRKAKAPGGYNYPLYESGIPFIFMNAAGTLRDVVTLLHEGGHAAHSFLMHDLELVNFKSTPSEIAELASMSMELITMDHWHTFFDQEDELKRAKKEHLEQVIETLPWVAVIDQFQHWIYENPAHTVEDRQSEWTAILSRFTSSAINYEGLDAFKRNMWQKQLHLYEVPFYYIEYAMAQLGAIAVWRNYKEDPVKALGQFKEALKAGYTHTIPETYALAGIKFDFSKTYISELMDFVQVELDRI